MKIVVCIKPVKSELVFPNELRNEAFVMNPYDLYALEECIKLKKQTDCSIACVCMGPRDSECILTKALAMGTDEAVLLNDAAFIGSDTIATAYILSKAVSKLGYVDLVVCGDKSIDGETGQVVYGISEHLKWFCASKVENVIEVSKEQIILQRKDNDVKTTVRFSMPAVISFHDFKLNQPNINLVALKKAKRKAINVWGANDLEADTCKCGTNGSKTKVLNIKSEFIKKKSTAVEGTTIDKVNLIFDIIYGRIGDR